MPSIAIPVSLRGQLLNSVRAVTAFSPSTLFALNEPGVWLDPSDVANLAWRRNLLTFTEQFDNAAWTKTAMLAFGSGSVANATTAPNGTTTADLLVPTTASAEHYADVPAATFVSGSSYTLSIYAKASGYKWIRLAFSSSVTPTTERAAWFDVDAGVVGTVQSNVTATITSVGDGWFRCSISRAATSSATPTASGFVLIANADNSTSFAANGTSGVFWWGAQLELGSTATDYQKITDVNTEVIERFPSATLYQDTAGTLPVTTPGQTVALALDKSKGLVLGSELVTNGDFATDTDWSKNGTPPPVISGGVASWAGTSNSFSLVQNMGLQTGKTYKVTFTVVTATSGVIFVKVNGGGTLSQSPNISSAGTYTYYLSSTAADGNLAFGVSSTFIGSIDNISVKELPGFHATQATLASRPTYGIVPLGGRRNLLTYSEQLNSSLGWQNQIAGTGATPTTTADAGTDPLGGTTAERLQSSRTTATSADRSVRASLVPVTFTNGVSYTCSFWAKSFSGANQDLHLMVNSNGTTVQSFVATSEWQRFTYSFTSGATIVDSPASVRFGLFGAASSALSSDVLLWGAQLETGSSATNYQRVGSAFDVTEAGVASLSYLSFDGVDDFLITPTITPGIDRAQVFAGVRKLSDAAFQVIAETSANIGTNAGAILASVGTSGNAAFLSRGSAAFVQANSSSVVSPISYVHTGIGDIAGDVTTLRINGSVAQTLSTDQGTGNYLAYPLYIGRRAGTSNPFNGQIYSLTVRFGANLDSTSISSMETWVAGKTGVTL